mmetsp:Transcript_62324/g.177011  ORF Transcript_62324/g.177011 Transcript_62324/m.177011 type:complete len:218 (-) Transcript_62324:22-675(-)
MPGGARASPARPRGAPRAAPGRRRRARGAGAAPERLAGHQGAAAAARRRAAARGRAAAAARRPGGRLKARPAAARGAGRGRGPFAAAGRGLGQFRKVRGTTVSSAGMNPEGFLCGVHRRWLDSRTSLSGGARGGKVAPCVAVACLGNNVQHALTAGGPSRVAPGTSACHLANILPYCAGCFRHRTFGATEYPQTPLLRFLDGQQFAAKVCAAMGKST